MIPVKPFDSYKWRWLSVAPTESLLEPPVFLGVLRVLARHENKAPSNSHIIAELQKVKDETGTPVNLARSGGRNLIRNSGQYWKGMGLISPDRGMVHLTDLGHKVADGQITQGEFAALMIQQTVLPNPWTYNPLEIDKWRKENIEIYPLKLILEVVENLRLHHGGKSVSYITNNELYKVVIPLAGNLVSVEIIADHIYQFRSGKLNISSWPDCVPRANDKRLAREFLLFLSNYGLLRLKNKGVRDEQKYYLEELIGIDMTAQSEASIFGGRISAEQAVEDVLHSSLPSIIERQRTLTTAYARRGQPKFRANIMKAFSNRCLLTDEEISEVLEAAHIIPVKHGGSDEKDNGLCLRVDIHRLFDSGNIRLKPDGRIVLSDVAAQSKNYIKLPKKITFPSFVKPANVAWRDSYF
jgi:hypothetical protein